jgi:poly(A) polymerase
LLDPDAVRAVGRLHSFGHEAYLVGGCVRDLLLGSRPKDFDIATSARPQVVKRSFSRNCRIIGRRFKLAHLHFDNNTKILEVSTFRRAPEPEGEGSEDGEEEQDLLITRDNEFGTAEQDALRRDFTINALFLDPIADQIIDHVGGLDDIERRLIRTIGDPYVRFREDPVRILRAIKFAGRLGLSIEEQTAAAMSAVAPDLVRAAPPRLLEEILRLLRGGHAFDAVERMRDCGALRAVLPPIDSFLRRADRGERTGFWRMLEALDARHRQTQRDGSPWPPENGLLLGCLFERSIRVAARENPQRSPSTLAEEIVGPFANAFKLPKRDAACVKRICAIQGRFHDTEPERKGRIEAMLHDPFFLPALELFELCTIADSDSMEVAAVWRSRANARFGRPRPMHADARRSGPPATPRPPEARKEAPANDAAPRDPAARSKAERRAREEERRRDRQKKQQQKRAERQAKRDERMNDRMNKRREARVESIEPVAVDVSAFDVELDPRQVPTFGSIVENDKKKQRRAPSRGANDDDYRPPPPPGQDGPNVPPPPPSDPGGFGDW